MKRSLLPLYLIVFAAYLGYSSMITVFTPMMMREKWGMIGPEDSLAYRMTLLGILLALYPFGQLFGSPLLVALSRRYDKRRLLLLSLCLTAAAYACVAAALHALHLSLLMAAVFGAGFFEANESIAEDLIAEIAGKEKHSKLMGYLHVSSSGAFLFGPILSGLLSLQYGLEGPFWGLFALILAVFLAALFLPSFPSLKAPISAYKALKNQLSIFSLGRFHFAFAVNALIYFAIFGFFRAYPMHLVEAFGFDIYTLSHYIAWVAVPIVLSNLGITAFLIRRFSAGTVLAFGSLGIGLFMLYFALLPAPGLHLWAALFLTGLSIGLCLPSSPIYIARAAKKSILSEVLESDLGLLKGAETLASLSGGALAALFIQLPLYLFAALAVAAAALLALRGFFDQARG